MLKTRLWNYSWFFQAYHLGEGRVLKTVHDYSSKTARAYHLGEGRVLKTSILPVALYTKAYHLGEGRVLKTFTV